VSGFAVGDRVRYWGGARPEGLAGEVVVVEPHGWPGFLIVNLSGTEVYANENSLTKSTA
jgi:hypothetical protein